VVRKHTPLQEGIKNEKRVVGEKRSKDLHGQLRHQEGHQSSKRKLGTCGSRGPFKKDREEKGQNVREAATRVEDISLHSGANDRGD